jgi:CheY-like chemotaxis protein
VSETWKIVLIDDEEDIRDVMALTLQDAGYDVRTAADGASGIRMCSEAADRRDGHPHARHGRAPGPERLGPFPTSRSSSPRPSVRWRWPSETLQLDASDFITKPIGNENLLLALNRARERYTARRRLKDYTLLLEREKAETSQQLLKTIAFQRNLIESSMDGIVGVDERDIVVIYNRRMEELVGYPGTMSSAR